MITNYKVINDVLTYCKGQYPGARYAWKAHEAYPPLQTLQAPKPANRIYKKYMFATPAIRTNEIYMFETLAIRISKYM